MNVGNEIHFVAQMRSIYEQINGEGKFYGTRKQKEIYAEAKAQSREDRSRLQETRREQKGSVATRMGDGQQVG